MGDFLFTNFSRPHSNSCSLVSIRGFPDFGLLAAGVINRNLEVRNTRVLCNSSSHLAVRLLLFRRPQTALLCRFSRKSEIVADR